MDHRIEIARQRSRFVKAFNDEDLVSLRRVFADEIVVMPPNLPPIVGITAVFEWLATGFDAARSSMSRDISDLATKIAGIQHLRARARIEILRRLGSHFVKPVT